MSRATAARAWLRRPLGRLPTAPLALALAAGPIWLFWDLLAAYRLHSDDFPYVAGSRTLARTIGNLFAPHNTHVVPAWRMTTWAVAAAAGRLAALPTALMLAAIGGLAALTLLGGHVVARETGRIGSGLAATALLGTTWLMKSSGTWYSAGQATAAGLGLFATLAMLQAWRAKGGGWRLGLAALAAIAAGWSWTVGHIAGPVGAVYLWADGRPRCRKAAAVPLAATLLAAGLGLGLGSRKMDATISFHGRTARAAFDPVNGVAHTVQAVPEDLILGNLGLVVETTTVQGAVFALGLALAWSWTTRPAPAEGRDPPAVARALAAGFVVAAVAGTAFLLVGPAEGKPVKLAVLAAFLALAGIVASDRGSPLERAGAATVLGAYLLEWSFRGYLPFSSLRGVVPWYDTIPHLGAVLFAAGWWARLHPSPPKGASAPAPLTRGAALGVVLLELALLAIHQPRVEALFLESVPKMSAEEARLFRIPSLQHLRAKYLAAEVAAWQRRHLARLDQAEAIARREGIGRAAIRRAFGRVKVPNLPDVYDAADMLALPPDGRAADPERVRALLGRSLAMEPEPVLPLDEVRAAIGPH